MLQFQGILSYKPYLKDPEFSPFNCKRSFYQIVMVCKFTMLRSKRGFKYAVDMVTHCQDD
jgi:hypothetical protein